MDASIQKGLVDRVYEKRKAATLALERQVRECLAKGERSKIDTIVQQLCTLLATPAGNATSSGYGYGYGNGASNVNAKNGGLIGLAGLAIALGTECAPYLDFIVPPILACFTDTDTRARYFACESFYNIVKVCKGEILVYFNEIFDVLSKLVSDSETSVKNGAELLDRLMKDIVCESAPYYVSSAQLAAHPRTASAQVEQQMPLNGTSTTQAELALDGRERELEAIRSFSLARFVPLLSERIHAVSPFTRDFLVSWITVLDSIPQLELVSFLADFLEGLFRYLDDANQDLRTSTAHVLDTFLDEIKDIARRRTFPTTQGGVVSKKQYPTTDDVDAASNSGSLTVSPTPSGRTSPVQRTSTPPTRGTGKRAPQSRIPRFARTRPGSPASSPTAAQTQAVDPAEVDPGTTPKQVDEPVVGTPKDDEVKKFDKPISSVAASKAVDQQDGESVPDTAQAEASPLKGKESTEVESKSTPGEKGEANGAADTNKVTVEQDAAGEPAPAEPKDGSEEEKEVLDGEDEEVQDTPTAKADAEGQELDPALSASSDEHEWLGSDSDLSEPEPEAEGEEQWFPGREVHIDYAAIVQILIRLAQEENEDILATSLQWISDFLEVVQDVVVPFTPKLLPVLLPLIAHPSPMIRETANKANLSLFQVIQDLPNPVNDDVGPATTTRSSLPSSSNTAAAALSHLTPNNKAGPTSRLINSSAQAQAQSQSKATSLQSTDSPTTAVAPLDACAEADSASESTPTELFGWRETIDALVDNSAILEDQARVTVLEWLMMLHRKAPSKFLALALEASDQRTYDTLLYTLQDPSQEVVETDLRLLAQLSSTSQRGAPSAPQGINESYLNMFMADLVKLFISDRRFLDARGSLIIRQLCVKLHPERTFRALAEIIEREENLEFASHMVQNLNFILITSPELANVRRRLRNVLSDGSSGKTDRDALSLFITLFKSWSHNSVAAFSLCLLAQAYEQASNLLAIFASEFDLSVSLLVQVDKLIQLLESPIFTYLRLQLLEPDRHPYLSKCLYGLLMLLPQSSAFNTLRSRLSAVSNVGFVHLPTPTPRSTYAANYAAAASGSSRKKDEGQGAIKWPELMAHFRAVQQRHDAATKAHDARTTWNQAQLQSRGKEPPAYVALRLAAEEYAQEQEERRKAQEPKAGVEVPPKVQERVGSPASEVPSIRRRQGLSRPPVSSRSVPTSVHRGRSQSGTNSISTVRSRDENK